MGLVGIKLEQRDAVVLAEALFFYKEHLESNEPMLLLVLSLIDHLCRTCGVFGETLISLEEHKLGMSGGSK
jgi:hypothetical protein